MDDPFLGVEESFPGGDEPLSAADPDQADHAGGRRRTPFEEAERGDFDPELLCGVEDGSAAFDLDLLIVNG